MANGGGDGGVEYLRGAALRRGIGTSSRGPASRGCRRRGVRRLGVALVNGASVVAAAAILCGSIPWIAPFGDREIATFSRPLVAWRLSRTRRGGDGSRRASSVASAAEAMHGGTVGAEQIAKQSLGLPRRVVAALVAAPLAAALDAAPVQAEVLRMTLNPLPKAYHDDALAAAQSLRDALVAEVQAGNAQLSPEEEQKLGAKERFAGQMVRKYGERYLAKNTLKDDDPLISSPVYYFLDGAIQQFRYATVETDDLPKYRNDIITKLESALDLIEKAGIEK